MVPHTKPVVRARAQVVSAQAPDLASLVSHYQEALRLRDWRIDVSYAPNLCQGDQPVWGLCRPVVDAKVATIVIRDPNTPPEGCTVEEAMAQVVETVVHELVHLHFAPFQNVSPTAVAAEEQAVWSLAEALIKAKGTPDEQRYARAMVAKVHGFAARAGSPQEKTRMQIDPKMIADGFMAVGAKDAKKCQTILAALLMSIVGGAASEAGEDPATEPVDPAPPAPDAQVVTPPEAPNPEAKDPMKRAVETPAPAASPASTEDPLVALGRAAMALVGAANPAEAMGEITRRNRLALESESTPKPSAEDRATLEEVERKKLVAKLVAVSAETPATAWEDAAAQVPCKRLAGEPLESLRARVTALEAVPRMAPLSPPARSTSVGSSADAVVKTMVVNGKSIGLTALDLRICEEQKCKVEDYAALKIQRDQGRSTGK